MIEADERPEWETWFMDFARLVARRADCTRRKVGAVIVRDNRIIATGYNGTLDGAPGCLAGACPRGQRTFEEVPAFSRYDSGDGVCIAIHAELNAILFAARIGISVDGTTMYVNTRPCDACARMIKQAGIVRVVCSYPSPNVASPIPQ